MNLVQILTGGFLKGYRTYILMGVAVIGVVANYVVGEADLVKTLTEVAAALGVASLRASVQPPAVPPPAA